MNDVVPRIARQDLSETLPHCHALTLRTSRHVYVGQGIGHLGVLGRELIFKCLGQAAGLGFDDRGRVVRHEPAQTWRGAAGPQVTRAVEGVQPSVVQHRRVPDVVKPGGRDEQIPIGGRQSMGDRFGSLCDCDDVTPTVRVDVEKQRCLGCGGADIDGRGHTTTVRPGRGRTECRRPGAAGARFVEARCLAMGDVRVTRWRRYGHDRLYVNSEQGEQLGWHDLTTGATHVAARDHSSRSVGKSPRWVDAQGSAAATEGELRFSRRHTRLL